MPDFFHIIRPATVVATGFKPLRPAAYVNKLRGSIVLPAFSYTGLTWKGASQLIVQFNFALASAFTFPVPLSGVGRNFCLCVRHRIGTTPYRYKLWENVGEILYVPTLYVSEIVRSYFTLEIWSTPASSVSLSSALAIPTSFLYIPAMSTDVSPVIIGTGAARVSNQFGAIQPVVTNVADYLNSN